MQTPRNALPGAPVGARGPAVPEPELTQRQGVPATASLFASDISVPSFLTSQQLLLLCQEVWRTLFLDFKI